MKTRLVPLLLAAAAVVPSFPRAGFAGLYVPGEVLVKFRAGAAPERRATAFAARAHRALSELHEDWAHVRVRPGESVEEAIAGYAADDSVEWAQPNYVYRANAVTPNDPRYGSQWALKNPGLLPTAFVFQDGYGIYSTNNPGSAGDDINVEPAWSLTDCSGVVVAVVDSGVKYDHEDLVDNMWNGTGCVRNGVASTCPNHGWDFVDGDDDPLDHHGHGTHVAGIIAARGNNGLGTAGVCWNARIMAVRVMDALGFGSSASIFSGIDFARENGAKVVNMSLGGSEFDAAYYDAMTRAQNAGVLVVVAAGNDGVDVDVSGNATYPCNFTHPNVLCVAALDQRFELAEFSNWGGTSVDVAAPGTNIVATWPGTDYAVDDMYTSGWSYSSTTAGQGGGWGVHVYHSLDYDMNFMSDPSYWGYFYKPYTDDRTWKTFDLSGDVVTMSNMAGAAALNPADWWRLGCKSTPGDPFSGGTIVEADQGLSTKNQFVGIGFDLASCPNGTATVGFQLQSYSASGNYGVQLSPFTLRRLFYGTESYNTIHGTSMATPVVAGIAAMLRSYNPDFTAEDAKAAIIGGSRLVTAPAGITVSNVQRPQLQVKAVQAMGSLTYIRPPTGLRAVVH